MAIYILFAAGFNFELEFKKKILSSNQLQINSLNIYMFLINQSFVKMTLTAVKLN